MLKFYDQLFNLLIEMHVHGEVSWLDLRVVSNMATDKES